MRTPVFPSLAAALCLGLSASVHAAVVINPSDDGALYVCDGCNTVNNGGYVTVAGYIQGIVKFSTAPISGPVAQALLTVNPYGLPLGNLNVDVYGIQATSGAINAGDANAGTFLGTMYLPSTLGYGQDATFDVTAFVASAISPFVGFNLRNSGGSDIFSSIEYNYGHPSQLKVTQAPEPTVAVLLIAGMGLLGPFRRVRAAGRAVPDIAAAIQSLGTR
jgi:hypothetical protein